MSDKYTLKIHTHSPKAAEQLIGGTGLESILKDTISSISNQMSDSHFMPSDSPFFLLKKSDFDPEDEVVSKYLSNLFDISKMPVKEAKPKFILCYEEIKTQRIANYRNNLRKAYNSIQNTLDRENEAVKMERVASKLENKSQGYWQIESLSALDNSLNYADSQDLNNIKIARDMILSGEKDLLLAASQMVKKIFESHTPKANTRLAYTSLSTQNNEPYLLCPKGNFVGKSAVPMEVSKCRENCIDSRVDKDGTVTCAYEDWLKVSFEPQNKVLGRLDVHKHPDNEANSLNLKEGERSKKLTEGEFGYEFRMTHNTQGANKIRNSEKNYEDSIETQLSNNKPSAWGHIHDDKPTRTSKQAQTDSTKTINTQLNEKHTKTEGKDFLEALLNKLNRIESTTDETREQQLTENGLQAHRGEMEESYSKQLSDKKEKPLVRVTDDIERDHNEPEDSISHILNKTAKKNNIRGLNDTLENSRKDSKGDTTREEDLADRRTNTEKDLDKSREELLAGLERDDWGHEYSDEEFKGFMKDLGIDSKLEDSRNIYKLEP